MYNMRCTEFIGKRVVTCQFEIRKSETTIVKQNLALFCGLKNFVVDLNGGPLP
jgi:hypothetical protein